MPREFLDALTESGLSRVQQAAAKYDIAMITAWRHAMLHCVNKEDCTGEVLSREQKNLRNKDLKASLLSSGYGVTAIDGNYIEEFGKANAVEVSENSYLVVNLKDDPNFAANIEKLGIHFCQASVFIKPVGKEPFLLGTNHEDFPGLGAKVHFNNAKYGWDELPVPATKDTPKNPGKPRAGQFYSKVGGRPFGWVECKSDYNVSSRYLIDKIGNRVLKEAGITHE